MSATRGCYVCWSPEPSTQNPHHIWALESGPAGSSTGSIAKVATAQPFAQQHSKARLCRSPTEDPTCLGKYWTDFTRMILWTSSIQKLDSTSHILPKADSVWSRRIAKLSAASEGSCGCEWLDKAGELVLCSGISDRIPWKDFSF